jgi:ribonuclease P protein component
MNDKPDLRQGRDRSLKRRVVMDRVFAEGRTAKGFPLLAKFTEMKPDGPAASRVAFTVSKKRFRRAVDRNKIKRLMRETWRHRRSPFESGLPEGIQCAVVLIFVGKDIPSAQQMDKAMEKLLARMSEASIPQE